MELDPQDVINILLQKIANLEFENAKLNAALQIHERADRDAAEFASGLGLVEAESVDS